MKEPKRKINVRWFSWYEVAEQIYCCYSAFRLVVMHPDDFGTATREKIRYILDPLENELKLELALNSEAALPICLACYYFERDGFVAPTAGPRQRPAFLSKAFFSQQIIFRFRMDIIFIIGHQNGEVDIFFEHSAGYW